MKGKHFLIGILFITALALAARYGSLPCHATTEYVYMGGWSYHESEFPSDTASEKFIPYSNNIKYHKTNVKASDGFNETHKIIGYQRNDYMIAHFYNSYNQSTWLVAKNFTWDHPTIKISFIGQLGLTYGYTDCEFKNRGQYAETCSHYQAGFAVTKFRLQPVVFTNGEVHTLALRYRI